MLPTAFLQRMEAMLGAEYPAFLESYEKPRAQALRINPQKTDPESFEKKAPFRLRPVPWEPNGFYYEEGDEPGKHVYHDAGLYYIQEPSAMLPAVCLDAAAGCRVLDLCAAPGGKSTQLAAAMQGRGLLVANEIHPARAKILSENIERMGVKNALVTNESPQTLAALFPAYFDRILVDAPCSGEGMFRKNEQAAKEWSLENVALCAKRQEQILDCAAAMLRPGGRMVYSTCTFAPEENEGSVSRFLERNPQFHLVQVPPQLGTSAGRPDWIRHPAPGISGTVRLFPHLLEGEGHFAAVLEKEGDACYKGSAPTVLPKGESRLYRALLEELVAGEVPERFVRFGEQLYLLPEQAPSLSRLRVLRPGLHLGTIKKNRLEPSHALALALTPQEARRVKDLDIEEARAYVSGQTLSATGEKGWYLLTVDGYSIGWGKLAGTVMKNHYPKGLRKGAGV